MTTQSETQFHPDFFLYQVWLKDRFETWRTRDNPNLGPVRNCINTEVSLWYPRSAKKRSAETKMCWSCPLQKECLLMAIVFKEEGIWGGFDADERQPIRARFEEEFDTKTWTDQDRIRLEALVEETLTKNVDPSVTC